jgi:DNA-binding HxlR family transcriptional regulator
MRSYRQYCGLARALDVVGDRWTLLIVRELMLRGQARYTDLQQGLPGIATNLLADRLKNLERAGVVVREAPIPPVSTDVFSLTEWGLGLRPVLHALGMWAGPLMGERRRGDAVRAHWLAIPLSMLLEDTSPRAAPVNLVIDTGDRRIVVRAGGGAVTFLEQPVKNPDAVMKGPPEVILALLSGRLDLSGARRKGLGFSGTAAVLDRLGVGLRRRKRAGSRASAASHDKTLT